MGATRHRCGSAT